MVRPMWSPASASNVSGVPQSPQKPRRIASELRNVFRWPRVQVSAAVGATVEEGTHVTPTFTKTCTWVVKNGGIIVTLNIEELAMFDAAKRSASLAGAQTAQASGVGDEAFYIDVGGALALHTKKGGAAFKVAVYSTKLSPDQKKSIERVLAQQAAAKF